MKQLILFFFIPLFIGLISCDKNEPKKNETFYCKVNGEAFRPRKDNSPIGGIGSNPVRVTYSKNDSTLTILVDGETEFIGLRLKLNSKLIEKGNYNLGIDNLLSRGTYSPNRKDTQIDYLYSNSGIISLNTIDNFNLKGTFEFTCKSNKTGKEYKVTEGQFNNISYY